MGAIGAGATLGGVLGGLARLASRRRSSTSHHAGARRVPASRPLSVLAAFATVRALRSDGGARRSPPGPHPRGCGWSREVPYLAQPRAARRRCAPSSRRCSTTCSSAAAAARFARGAPLMSLLRPASTAAPSLLAFALQAGARERARCSGSGWPARWRCSPPSRLLGSRRGARLPGPGGASWPCVPARRRCVTRPSARATSCSTRPLPPSRSVPTKVIIDVGLRPAGDGRSAAAR